MLRDKVGVKINSQVALRELLQYSLLLPALTASGPGIYWLMRIYPFDSLGKVYMHLTV
jgi:hypothetical protein